MLTFSDASQGALWCSCICKIEYKYQIVSVRFVVAKTKMAPLQSVNVPRMELMGACLGVKLVQSTVKVIGIAM